MNIYEYLLFHLLYNYLPVILSLTQTHFFFSYFYNFIIASVNDPIIGTFETCFT